MSTQNKKIVMLGLLEDKQNQSDFYDVSRQNFSNNLLDATIMDSVLDFKKQFQQILDAQDLKVIVFADNNQEKFNNEIIESIGEDVLFIKVAKM